MKKILVVDDNEELRANLAEVLKGAGYHTDEAATGREAIEKASAEEFHAILLDLMMPKMNGIAALSELRRICPWTKIIMITAFATVENAIDAIKKGASDYLSKPFKIEDILSVISRVLEEARFEEGINKLSMDNTLSALANSIRRKIIKLLSRGTGMRLMEITRELGIEDHTKVVFHLKMLAEAGLLEQSSEKIYLLTKEGERAVDCLKILENYLGNDRS